MIFNKNALWTFLLRRMAKAGGFLDPASVFSSLQHFSKPSEVWVPTELLRSGAILQARGLINSQAIQHNLDWVWPYWVNHQFNPKDVAYIPRAFGISHINLSNRNWTALGIPDFEDYPIVDPRGLITPFWDSWSIDVWIMAEGQPSLFPSKLAHAEQAVDLTTDFRINTTCQTKNAYVKTTSRVYLDNNIPTLEINFKAQTNYRAWLMIVLRPYNPEGVSFIHNISCLEHGNGWKVNKEIDVQLMEKPSRYVFSNYNLGDISQQIPLYYKNTISRTDITCPVGMAASAAVYEMDPITLQEVTVKIPLSKKPVENTTTWAQQLEGHCAIRVPDKLFQSIYDIAVRSLILHSPGDVFPGPFTYKKFWFRDAAYILNAMMAIGLLRNVEKIIDHFPKRQTPMGYYKSQDGEWDSNGQALWIMQRYSSYMNIPLKQKWIQSIIKGATWIENKRVDSDEKSAHAGLLPAGFSAEHFGPNDYYYWDDYWAVAGLRSAAAALKKHDMVLSDKFNEWANDLSACIDKSLEFAQLCLNSKVIPSSAYRRMDDAAIGSMVAGYPLQLYTPKDPALLATANYLLNKCFLDGAFYHEISHSGINIYLTLHVAQVLLRAGDTRFFAAVKATAQLASPTGQWPEAIHPQTKGGCMGDGQHIWATAEWVLMIRNMFVREEESTKTLILCSGIPQEWLDTKETMYLGYTLTIFGKVAVTITHHHDHMRISWNAKWHNEPPNIEIHLMGHPPITVNSQDTSVKIMRMNRKDVA